MKEFDYSKMHPYTDVIEERRRQDAKWGVQNHDLATWVTILAEEVGELAQAALKGRRDDARAEAVQVAAVAMAIIQCLDRNERSEPRPVESA